MDVRQLRLDGVLLFEPPVFRDGRGHFMELWRANRYEAAGIEGDFVQDNVALSEAGVLRGLHYQHPSGQGKLVTVVQGRVLDVVVDIRRGSPTFGRWIAEELSGENGRQLYVPAGFAHGYLALDRTVFVYKCTEYYAAADEGSVRWDDPELAIEWRVDDPRLSEKDRTAPALQEIDRERLPVFRAR